MFQSHKKRINKLLITNYCIHSNNNNTLKSSINRLEDTLNKMKLPIFCITNLLIFFYRNFSLHILFLSLNINN